MKRKLRRILLTLFAVFLLIMVISPVSEQKIEGINIEDLEIQRGLFNESSLILNAYGLANASSLQATLSGEVRTNSSKTFGRMTLPEGVSVFDVFEDYPEYAKYFQLDYYINKSEINVGLPIYQVEDPYYTYQEYLQYTNLGAVWQTTKGNQTVVAIIDTGIDTSHPEFQGKIHPLSYNASSDQVGIAFVEDEDGHGTAVAGVIAAPMNSLGIVGIAPETTLLIIKCDVNEDGQFVASSDLVFGIYYAIEMSVDVINMSFGVELNNPFDIVLKLAVDSDIIPVAAAGNRATPALTYPAADPHAIGVGALENNQQSLASYSNYGDNVKLVAPGTVYTTLMGSEYGYMSGTSFSAPIVAGAIALYKSLFPNLTYAFIVELLEASSVDLGELGSDWYYGFGALDIDALILQPKGYVTFDYLTTELANTKKVFVVGRALQAFPEPERSMLVYDGWYFDIHTTDELEYYVDAFSSDLTIYARWINEDEGIPYAYTLLPDDTIRIDAYFGKMRYLIIPNEIEGKLVSTIGVNAFAGNQRIRQITLPNQLRIIEDYAFSQVRHLNKIEIPDTVVSIGNFAFANNLRLGSVLLSETSQLVSIGMFAFANNINLQRLDLPVGLQEFDGSAVYGCISLRDIFINEANPHFVIEENVVLNANRTQVIVTPAMRSNPYIVPNSVVSINPYAFAFTRRTEVSLPEGLEFIKTSAFENASSLRSVVIPSTVKQIESKAFQLAINLRTITFAANSQLEVIGEYAFQNNSSVQSIQIPQSVTSIQDFAFAYNPSLREFTFEANNQLSVIPIGMLYGAHALEVFSTPSSVISVGHSAFYNAFRMHTFIPSNSLQMIGSFAFGNTWALQSFISPSSLLGVDDYAFHSSGIESFYVGMNLQTFGEAVFGSAERFSTVLVHPSNVHFTVVDGVLFSSNLETLVVYPQALSSTYVIPEGVKEIGPGAFYGNRKITSVTYPSTLEIVGSFAFFFNELLTNPILPESLREIREFAYSVNMTQTSVTIPDAVEFVGRFAFNGNYRLKSITLSPTSNLTRIGFAAFAGTGIEQFFIPSGVTMISQGAFANSGALQTVFFGENSQLTYIASDIFTNAINLTNIVISSGSQLEEIQAYGFSGLPSLESIDLSYATKLKRIGNYAFFGNGKLQTVILPDSLESIGRFAFGNTFSLEMISIPQGVDFIGSFAFFGSKNVLISFESSYEPSQLQEAWDQGIGGYLVNIASRVTTDEFEYAVLNDGFVSIIRYLGDETELTIGQLDGLPVTSIQAGAFRNHPTLEAVILPNTIQVISREAFANIPNLREVVLGNQVRSIQDSAFANTPKLTLIQIPDSVVEIGKYAFYQSGLETIEFGLDSNLVTIGSYAFAASKLQTIAIPHLVKEIQNHAFFEALSLQSIQFENSTPLRINDYVFYNSGLTSISIPENLYYIGEFAFAYNRQLTTITVDSANLYYASLDGVLYNKDYTRLITYPAGKSGAFSIPESVTLLAFSAFEGAHLLEEVQFHPNNKIMSIGIRTFYGASSLTSITIPDNMISIGFYAFAQATALQSVLFSSQSQLTMVMDGAFYNASSLETISLPIQVLEIGSKAFENTYALTSLPYSDESQIIGIYDAAFKYSGITSITFPETLIEIGSYAFEHAKVGELITELVIPQTVQFIGYSAFKGFDSIESITIPFIGSDLFGIESHQFVYIFGSTNDLPSQLHRVVITEGIETVGVSAFNWAMQIREVVLPDSVLSIQDSAFFVAGLREIRLPSHLAYIGNWAFYNFQGDSIVIPESVQYIGQYAFMNWNGILYLEHEQIPLNWNPNWAYNDTDYRQQTISIQMFFGFERYVETEMYRAALLKDNTAVLIKYFGQTPVVDLSETFAGYTLVGIEPKAFVIEKTPYQFEVNYTITDIIVPESVHYIGQLAFANLAMLSTITLPNQLKSIEPNLFMNTPNLKQITLPSQLEVIGTGAFASSTLTEINLPPTLRSIGTNPFPSTLETIFIPQSVEHLGMWALNPQKTVFFQSSHLPTYLGSQWEPTNGSYYLGISYVAQEDDFEYVLDQFDEILITKYTGQASHVEIPSTLLGYPVMGLVGGLFKENKQIESVILPEGLTTISHELFKNASFLHEVTIPSTILSIGNDAFMGTAIKHMVLPEGVLSIGSNAFAYMNELESIQLPNSLISIGSGAFAWATKLTSIHIPNSVESIGSYAFSSANELANITLSTKLKSIGQYAFSDTKISSLMLPDSIETVGINIIHNTPLYHSHPDGMIVIDGVFLTTKGKLVESGTLIIPSEVRVIAHQALGEQSYLYELVLPDTIEFYNGPICSMCSELRRVTFSNLNNDNILPSYTAPNISEVILLPGISSIPKYTFSSYKNLSFISIPESVVDVGEYAFHDAISLTSLHFPAVSIVVEPYALLGATNITHLTISGHNPWTLRTLFGYAYQIPASLKTVEIVSGSQAIHPHMFDSAVGLESIVLPASLGLVSPEVFGYTPQAKVYFHIEEAAWVGSPIPLTTYWVNQWFYASFIVEEKIYVKTPIAVGNPIILPTQPTKPSTPEYDYQFIGWDINGDGSIDSIPGTLGSHTSFEALFSQSIRNYQIDFYDEYGNFILDTMIVPYGSDISEIFIPTKQGNAQYQYRFTGWSEDLSFVRRNMDVRATFAQEVVKYLVTFYDAEGNIYHQQNLEFGNSIYVPVAPMKDSTTYYEYEFSYWSPNVYSSVFGTHDFYPIYSERNRTYYIDLETNGGEPLNRLPIQYESVVSSIPTPVKEGHQFLGWFMDETFTISFTPFEMSTNDVSLYAKWQIMSYQLTILGLSQEILYQSDFEYGTIMSYQELHVEKAGYTHIGFSETLPQTMPANDLTITVLYQINQYELKYVDEFGSVLWAYTLDYQTDLTVYSQEVPNKIGHTILGWSIPLPETMPANDVTLQATYQVNQYRLSFETNGGDQIDPINIDFGQSISLPIDPQKEGHIFGGWYTNESLTNVFSQAIMSDSNLTIYAKWNVESYTIAFLDWNNDVIYTEDIPYGESLESLQITSPTRVGFTFQDWNIALPATMPAQNLQFVAHYTKNIHSIQLVDEEGIVVVELSVAFGESLANIEIPSLPKQGYTWLGFVQILPQFMPDENLVLESSYEINQYLFELFNDDGTSLVSMWLDYQSDLSILIPQHLNKVGHQFIGFTPTVPNLMPDGDVSATAQYEKNQYTIEFVTSTTLDINPIIADYEEAVIPPLSPQRVGYTFGGWYLDETFEEEYTTWKIGASNITLYAKWTINQYRLQLIDLNNQVIYSEWFDYGSTIDLTNFEIPNVVGYKWVGWNQSIPQTMPANNILIRGLYEVMSYNIHFNALGGYELDSITKNYREDLSSIPNATRQGYTFAGWYTDVELSQPFGYGFMPAEDVTLYAKWEVNYYLLQVVNSNNQVVYSANVSYQFDLASLDIPVPSVIGYEFVGWDIAFPDEMPDQNLVISPVYHVLSYSITILNEDDDLLFSISFNYGDPVNLDSFVEPGKTGYTFDGFDKDVPEIMPAEEIILKVQYQINSYEVIFKDYNGTILKTETVEYGSGATAPSNPSRTGYTFISWDKAFNSITNDLVLSAQYTINSYEVVFKDYNGTVLKTQTVEYGSAATAPSNPSRTGYTFSNWDEKFNNITSDLVVSAQYTINSYEVIFKDFDGSIIKTESVEFGSSATAPINPSRTGYTFLAWDQTYSSIESDLIVMATYQINQYTYTFYHDDMTVYQTVTVEYGQKPTLDLIPSKPEDEKYRYSFKEWNQVIPEQATQDVAFTAVFQAVPKVSLEEINQALETISPVSLGQFSNIMRAYQLIHPYQLEYPEAYASVMAKINEYNQIIQKANEANHVSVEVVNQIFKTGLYPVTPQAQPVILVRREEWI